MKAAQVRIGLVCATRVGSERVIVRVICENIDCHGRTRYVVARVDTGRELPKRRVASALHPVAP